MQSHYSWLQTKEGTFLFLEENEKGVSYSWQGETFDDLIHGQGVLKVFKGDSLADKIATNAYYGAISAQDVISVNDTTKYVLAINALILTLIFVLNIRKYEWKLQLRNIVNTLPILGISLMTIVWYLVLANHTQIHPFLAFRTAFVLILSCLVTIYKSLLI